MLRKSQRFHGPKAVGGLIRSGQTKRSKHLSVRRKPSESWRVAVVVKKKLYKSAVARNRLRRQVFACVQELAKDPEVNVYKIIFFVNSSKTHELTHPELKKQVKELLK